MNLLTGSTGFVGGHVVEYLFQQGEISKGIFRKGSHLKIMDSNGVQGIEADLLDHDALHEAIEGADTIYSMASPTPYGDSGFEKANSEGILNLLEVANEMKVKTLVHLSTLDVFGFGKKAVEESSPPRPSDGYQRSKLEADRLLLEFGKRTAEPRIVIVRPAKAVGSRDPSFVVPLLRMIGAGKASLPGSTTMSFTHPKDIAQAMYRGATNSSLKNRIFLVKSFDAAPEEFARQLVSTLGATSSVGQKGMFGRTLLPPYTSEQLRASLGIGAQESWKELGYSPQFDMKQTCQEIAQWYRKEPWVTEAA